MSLAEFLTMLRSADTYAAWVPDMPSRRTTQDEDSQKKKILNVKKIYLYLPTMHFYNRRNCANEQTWNFFLKRVTIGSLSLDVKTYNDDYRFKRDTSIDANFFAFLFFANNRKKFRILWEEGEEIVKQLLLAYIIWTLLRKRN